MDFERQTARVIIDIENSTFSNEFTNPVVAGINIYSQLELPATQGADVSAIKAYKMDDANPKSSWVALVAPNAEDANKDFICISVQENGTGMAKAYSIKGIPNLERGKSYTYKLKIGKDKAIIDNVTVTDWKEGTAVPGGEASLVTFAAIKDAIKDKGVSEGQVDLTLKGVMRIPQKAFGNLPEGVAPWFNVVCLPDATIIDDYAFQGSNLTAIYAPKVEEINYRAFNLCHQLEIVDMRKASRIKYRAFEECGRLDRVRFGALSSVGQIDRDGRDGIFKNCKTEIIDLTLSSRQSMMQLLTTAEATYEWCSTRQSYWDTEDYTNKKFLGYKFNHIYRVDD